MRMVSRATSMESLWEGVPRPPLAWALPVASTFPCRAICLALPLFLFLALALPLPLHMGGSIQQCVPPYI